MVLRSSACAARSVLIPNTRDAGDAGGNAAHSSGGAGEPTDFAEQVATGHRTGPDSRIAPRAVGGASDVIVLLSFGYGI